MKHFLVIGDPIDHSLSPLMHHWIFDSLGIVAEYKKVKVKTDKLPKYINKIKSGELDGANITIPHKEAIMGYLDEINHRAKIIGAVNCVMRDGTRSIGNNTDWYGFSMTLKIHRINLNNRKVIILGAGGSAKSIIFSLQQMGLNKIFLLNRSIEKARSIQNEGILIDCIDNVGEIINNNSVIINTTSVGMQNSKSPIDLELLHKNQIIIDIIYTPLETRLLKFGKKAGAFTVNGLDMFIHQGLASLDLWFGSSISTQVNLPELKTYLEAQLC